MESNSPDSAAHFYPPGSVDSEFLTKIIDKCSGIYGEQARRGEFSITITPLSKADILSQGGGSDKARALSRVDIPDAATVKCVIGIKVHPSRLPVSFKEHIKLVKSCNGYMSDFVFGVDKDDCSLLLSFQLYSIVFGPPDSSLVLPIGLTHDATATGSSPSGLNSHTGALVLSGPPQATSSTGGVFKKPNLRKILSYLAKPVTAMTSFMAAAVELDEDAVIMKEEEERFKNRRVFGKAARYRGSDVSKGDSDNHNSDREERALAPPKRRKLDAGKEEEDKDFV